MNDKIKKLAEQAGLEMCGCGCNTPTRQSAKFAKLIINECCDVVINSDPSPKMILHEPYRTIMNNIQEHFGVDDER